MLRGCFSVGRSRCLSRKVIDDSCGCRSSLRSGTRSLGGRFTLTYSKEAICECVGNLSLRGRRECLSSRSLETRLPRCDSVGRVLGGSFGLSFCFKCRCRGSLVGCCSTGKGSYRDTFLSLLGTVLGYISGSAGSSLTFSEFFYSVKLLVHLAGRRGCRRVYSLGPHRCCYCILPNSGVIQGVPSIVATGITVTIAAQVLCGN